MKQKVWSLATRYIIQDDAGQDRYHVDGQFLTLGNKLTLTDTGGTPLATVEQKLLAWGQTYEVFHGQSLYAVVKEKWLPLTSYRFGVDVNGDGPGPGDLQIDGDFWSHEYTFTKAGRPVAAVSKQWFAWADAYGVDVSSDVDDVLVLACTIVVDLCTQKHQQVEVDL